MRASATHSTTPSLPATTMRGGTSAAAANVESSTTVTSDSVRSHAVSPSSTSTGWSAPSASGRSGMAMRRCALTSATSPNSQRTVSTACDPHAPTQPPPDARSNSHPYRRSGTRLPAL